jgi:hypothetical protein
MLCKIGGFHGGNYGECRLLGYNAVKLFFQPHERGITFLRNVGLYKSNMESRYRRLNFFTLILILHCEWTGKKSIIAEEQWLSISLENWKTLRIFSVWISDILTPPECLLGYWRQQRPALWELNPNATAVNTQILTKIPISFLFPSVFLVVTYDSWDNTDGGTQKNGTEVNGNSIET